MAMYLLKNSHDYVSFVICNYSHSIPPYHLYEQMPRLPTKENTASRARNRLMVDHSPPRDARKRKFQKLDRKSRQEGYVGLRASTIPKGRSSSYVTSTSKLINPFFNVEGDDNERAGPLPIKNKVCVLYPISQYRV